MFEIKRNPDGSVDQFIARLEISDEIYSSITISGSVGVCEGLNLIQSDECCSFLYGTIQGCIYLNQPQGFHDGSSHACAPKCNMHL